MQVAPRAESFSAVREAASRVLELDKENRKAATRLHIVTIRMAQSNVPMKPGELEKSIKALHDLAKKDPTDPEAPFWAIQGDIYLAVQTGEYRQEVERPC